MVSLPFTSPWLLAPMEGVTDPIFRSVVCALHRPEYLGGVCTEFLRISHGALPKSVIRRHLGDHPFKMPLGLQLMGAHEEGIVGTAVRAAEIGVPFIDLNFGCPAKGALRGCAGSAVLDDPKHLERMVQLVHGAVGGLLPVTAKIRSGSTSASNIEVISRAAEAGGASLLTVHYRTRAEAYCREVYWDRIARSVSAVGIPVCGNGSVESHADLERMRRETGCQFVMVGRAALGDPWIFSGKQATGQEAAAFLLNYFHRIAHGPRGNQRGAFARLKQLVRYWTAGGIVGLTEEARLAWLREPKLGTLLSRLEAELS